MAGGTPFLGNLTNLFAELGLTSLATQSPASVAITGGSVTGLSSLSSVGPTTLSSGGGQTSIGGALSVAGGVSTTSLSAQTGSGTNSQLSLSTSSSSNQASMALSVPGAAWQFGVQPGGALFLYSGVSGRTVIGVDQTGTRLSLGATGGVTTVNNTLDDGSGNAGVKNLNVGGSLNLAGNLVMSAGTQIYAGGNGALYINYSSTGNVSIAGGGGTTSTGGPLMVSGTLSVFGTSTFNTSGGAAPTASSNTPIQLYSAAGNSTRLLIDSVGFQSNLILRRADGTVASPSALAAGEVIGQITGFGYGASNYCSGNRAALYIATINAFPDTDQSTPWGLTATPPGTTISLKVFGATGTGLITTLKNTLDDGFGNSNLSGSLTVGGTLSTGVSLNIASAGTTQASATSLTNSINVVTSGGSSSGVVLSGAVGQFQTIINQTGNSIFVYPSSGSAIEAGSINSGTSFPNGSRATYVAVSSTQIYQVA